MKVLVTGGTGFLGRHLQARLTLHGNAQFCYANSMDCDLRNQAAVNAFFLEHKFTHVIHLAASVGGIGANKQNPGKYCYENLIMGCNVIEAARLAGIHKLICVGTVCFPKGTMINTNSGWKCISNINEFDDVVTHTGKLKPVTQTMCRDYDGPIQHIKINGILDIKSTPKHPFLTERGWIEAVELRQDDRILVPITHNYKDQRLQVLQGRDLLRWVYHHEPINKVEFAQKGGTNNQWRDWKRHTPKCARITSPFITTNDIAWLFGTYAAEGFRCKNDTGKRGSKHYLYWATNHEERRFRLEINSEYYKLFGKTMSEVVRETATNLEVGDKYTIDLFDDFYYDGGTTAEFKKVPDSIADSSDSTIKLFIKGYWKGDGHWAERAKRPGQYIATCNSTSLRMILDIQKLLLKLGIFSTVHPRKKQGKIIIQGREVETKDSWSIRITGKWAIIFIETVLNEKLDRKNWINRKNDAIINYNHASLGMSKNTQEDFVGVVYNISIRDDESYIVQNVAVHNCSYPKHCEIPFVEEDLWKGYPEETNAPYGIAKKAILEMLKGYHTQYGMDYTYLIPVNMYGEFDNFDPKSSHVIPALVDKIIAAKRKGSNTIEVWGTGKATREFVHASDVANAIVKALYIETDVEPLNVGSGEEISIADLVDKIAIAAEWSGKMEWLSDKPDGQPRRLISSEKAYRILDYQPEITLDEGLKRLVAWREATCLPENSPVQ